MKVPNIVTQYLVARLQWYDKYLFCNAFYGDSAGFSNTYVRADIEVFLSILTLITFIKIELNSANLHSITSSISCTSQTTLL